MDITSPITVTLLGGLGTCIGYLISNRLERQKALQLREIEFRLERYREYLLALMDDYSYQTFDTGLQFVNCTNVILLIGGPGLLEALKDFRDNFNNARSEDEQWKIVNRIVFQMRCDLNTPDSRQLKEFEFPLIVPPLSRRHKDKPSRSPKDPPSGSSRVAGSNSI